MVQAMSFSSITASRGGILSTIGRSRPRKRGSLGEDACDVPYCTGDWAARQRHGSTVGAGFPYRGGNGRGTGGGQMRGAYMQREFGCELSSGELGASGSRGAVRRAVRCLDYFTSSST